jgi:hypothetical protein
MEPKAPRDPRPSFEELGLTRVVSRRRIGKRQARMMAELVLERPWREIERAANHREPIETEGVDATLEETTIKEATVVAKGT